MELYTPFFLKEFLKINCIIILGDTYMNAIELMKQRHSVRTYNNMLLNDDEIKKINDKIIEINECAKLHIQLITNNETCFNGIKATYGKFKGVMNYIALIGNADDIYLEEKCGFYGELLVMEAIKMNLATCWVGMTCNKKSVQCLINDDEKLIMVIAIGHADKMGIAHKSKSIEELSNVHCGMPLFFKLGMEAVMLAPTAMNQQKFKFNVIGNKVIISTKSGFYVKTDLGIAVCHFMLGASMNEEKYEIENLYFLERGTYESFVSEWKS